MDDKHITADSWYSIADDAGKAGIFNAPKLKNESEKFNYISVKRHLNTLSQERLNTYLNGIVQITSLYGLPVETDKRLFDNNKINRTFLDFLEKVIFTHKFFIATKSYLVVYKDLTKINAQKLRKLENAVRLLLNAETTLRVSSKPDIDKLIDDSLKAPYVRAFEGEKIVSADALHFFVERNKLNYLDESTYLSLESNPSMLLLLLISKFPKTATYREIYGMFHISEDKSKEDPLEIANRLKRELCNFLLHNFPKHGKKLAKSIKNVPSTGYVLDFS